MVSKYIDSGDPASPAYYVKLDLNFIHNSIQLFIITTGLAHYRW